jgi:hypothetical protein
MEARLDGYLVEKYPKIFINRYSSIKYSAMGFGFEHDDGWFWLLDQLCSSIQCYIDNQNEYQKEESLKISQVVADQVKEKFGLLNFYYSGGDDTIYGMVRLTENMSGSICERCGTTDHVGKTISGWIYTICKNCYDKDEQISRYQWEENKNSIFIPSKELRKIKIDKINSED